MKLKLEDEYVRYINDELNNDEMVKILDDLYKYRTYSSVSRMENILNPFETDINYKKFNDMIGNEELFYITYNGVFNLIKDKGAVFLKSCLPYTIEVGIYKKMNRFIDINNLERYTIKQLTDILGSRVSRGCKKDYIWNIKRNYKLINKITEENRIARLEKLGI